MKCNDGVVMHVSQSDIDNARQNLIAWSTNYRVDQGKALDEAKVDLANKKYAVT